ncbi:hypothetical protein Tco_0150151 [Tanacetum coccineum]
MKPLKLSPSASAILMAKLSAYDSNVLSEVPTLNTYQNNNVIDQESKNAVVQDTTATTQQDAMIISIIEEMSNQVAQCNEVNKVNKTVNESLTAELKRYKEQIKIFEERRKFDLTDREKYIDGQIRVRKHDQLFVIDTEEALKLVDESNLKLHAKQNDLIAKEKKVNIAPIDYATLNNCVVPANDNNLAYAELEHSYIDEYSKVLELETELSKKQDMVEKVVYDELSNRCSRIENRCISLEIKVQQYKESFQNNRSCQNQDVPAFLEFFKINDLKARLQRKNATISNLKDHIATLKAKSVSDYDVQVNNSHVIALGMYKLDMPPRSPKLKRNKEVHVDYLKQAKSHGVTLRDIVEQARALKPLDNVLDYACKVKSSTRASRSHPSGNTKKNKISPTTSSNQKNIVEDHLRSVKSSLNKKNRVSECNTSTKTNVLKENSKSVYKTCNECLFNACYDLCVVDYLNNVNMRAKSRSVKSNKKQEWKPTGDVFTIVGHRWIPRGQTFTIDGNKYPLTRITFTTVVPPKTPVPAKVVKKTPPSSKNLGKPNAKNVGSSSKSKSVESKISINSEPNKNWGSTVSTSPSSSRVHFRSFKSSSGT